MEIEDQRSNVVDDIDLMKDVCELLMYDSEYLMDEIETTAVNWFKSWARNIQTQNDESSLLQPYLVTVLRDYLLSHAWTNSLTVLCLLGNNPNHSAVSLWKVGMEIMYSNPEKNNGLIEHFVRKLKGMSDLELKEVVLEYVMYLLQAGELDEAKRAMLDIPKIRGIKKSDRSNNQHQELVFQAYQGLLYYTRWDLDRQRLASQTTEAHGDDFGLYYFDGDGDSVRDSAERAVSCFSQLYDHLGVWDIFVTKHVQILEHYYRLEEARTVLESYRDRNKENPNTHKYLYKFCSRYSLVNRDCLTQLLRAVADCVPSDSLVMDLCERYIEDGNVGDLLFYIFELKDYKCWQKDTRSWQILSTALQLAWDSNNQDLMYQLWRPRKSWWPAYHFTYVTDESAEQGWVATAGQGCVVTAGQGSMVTAGQGSVVTAGQEGRATSDQGDVVTADQGGVVTADQEGVVTFGQVGVVTADHGGVVTADQEGMVTDDPKDLWLHRACCSVFLTGPENHFAVSVRQALSGEQIQHLHQVTKKVMTSSGVT